MMDDLISRQAAIDKITEYGSGNVTYMSVVELKRRIEHLPSTQPETHEERTETHACDYINRKDAIDAHYEYCNKHPDAGFPVWSLKILEDLPSAQPEIIRCKSCKHQVKEWRTDKRLKDKGYMVCGCDVVGDACGFWALLGQDDDYCSKAERRTDE